MTEQEDLIRLNGGKVKRTIVFCFLIAYTFSFSGGAMATPSARNAPLKSIFNEPTDSGSEEGPQGKSVRYEAAMRDLDREYQAGGLTKTEYIQRKREIDNLEL